jgi:hypothetical protein
MPPAKFFSSLFEAGGPRLRRDLAKILHLLGFKDAEGTRLAEPALRGRVATG